MKNNFMKLFYLVFTLSTIMFLIFLYVRYEEIKKELYAQQNYKTMLLSNITNMQFLRYEELLDLLGHHLLMDKRYQNTTQTHKVFQSILQLNKEVVGFGLIDTKGNYLALSNNLDPKKMPNLLTKKESKVSFKKAIVSKTMVIGRTYYLHHIKAWIMPLRKAIYNSKSEVIALMTAGLRVHCKNSFLHDFTLQDTKLMALTNSADKNDLLYRMYYQSDKKIDKEKLYNTPIPLRVYKNAIESIFKRYKITLNDLLNPQNILSLAYNFEIKDAWNKEIYASLSYNKRYQYYTVTGNDTTFIYEIFLKNMKIYFLLYLLSQLIFYFFFLYIYKSHQEKQNSLEYEATHDDLTKLPNKKYLYQNFYRYAKKNKEFVVMYIDLDNFKNINENFGHPIGDKLIQKIALRVEKSLLNDAMLIRDGGDEFILLKQYTKEYAQKYYHKFIELLGKTFVIENMEFKISSSIGIAHYPKDSQNLTQLLSMADMAMYEAKKLKNTYAIYTEKLKAIQNKSVKIDQEMRYALARNEIFMMYQPQMNADGTLYGVEALVRWNNKALGFVGPEQFIPIAEESNLIIDLGRYITYTSACEIDEIQKKLNITFQLSINLSVKQLLSPHFIDNLLDDIAIFKNNFSTITFEITERLFIEDLSHVLPQLNILKEIGFEISLDDFGTGYSSLSLLKNLPIDELKIDKSFIDEIIENKDADILSQTILNIGKDLSMKTVAEGVGTQAQFALLKEQKCDIFQGYYFSKPLTKEQLILFIQNLSFKN